MNSDSEDLRVSQPSVREVVADALSGLAAALVAAAATVAALLWISTGDEVGELGPTAYLIWPPVVAALTLRVKAHAIRNPAGSGQRAPADPG